MILIRVIRFSNFFRTFYLEVSVGTTISLSFAFRSWFEFWKIVFDFFRFVSVAADLDYCIGYEHEVRTIVLTHSTYVYIAKKSTYSYSMLRISAPRVSAAYLSLWELLNLRVAHLGQLNQGIVTLRAAHLGGLNEGLVDTDLGPNKRNGSRRRHNQVYYVIDPVACGALHRSRARLATSYSILSKTL